MQSDPADIVLNFSSPPAAPVVPITEFCMEPRWWKHIPLHEPFLRGHYQLLYTLETVLERG